MYEHVFPAILEHTRPKALSNRFLIHHPIPKNETYRRLEAHNSQLEQKMVQILDGQEAAKIFPQKCRFPIFPSHYDLENAKCTFKRIFKHSSKCTY